MTRSNREFTETIQAAQDWASSRIGEIVRLLPFNPVVAKKAFDELLFPEKAGNWKEISNLFATDPGLMSKFYEESRRLLKLKNKPNRTIRNIEDAVALLGIRTVVEVLERAMSDEIIEKMSKVPYVEMQLIWKESWGTGYAAELLAPHWKLDSSKALHIGLLADIGMLILSQLFKIDYFLKADAMFQEKAEDIYESSGSLRAYLEKKHFGISHPELGCWLLHYFGLNEDYAKAVLFHEEEDVEAREERYPFLINTSRRIARLVLMDDKFKKFYDGKNTLEIEHNFATANLRTKYTIYSLLDNHLGLVQKEADKVITDVAYRIKKHSENISGNISLLMEKDFLDALSSISANRDKAIRKLASLLDTEIGSRLPQPAAALYKKIANPKAGAMEYPTMITNILSMFIRILSSISLCLLLYSYGQRRDKFAAAVKKLFEGKGNGKIFLDMGGGMEASLLLCRAAAVRLGSLPGGEETAAPGDGAGTGSGALSTGGGSGGTGGTAGASSTGAAGSGGSQPPAGSPTAGDTPAIQGSPAIEQFVRFVVQTADDVFRICRIRKELKTGRSNDVQFLIQKLSSVLKGYSSLRSDIYAVTGLDYISEDPKTPFRIDLINWNDIMPVELRDPLQVKRSSPMSSGEQGVFFYTQKSKQFQILPDFLIFKKCPQCKKRHFYIADTLRLRDSTVDGGVSVRMVPVSEDHNCAPVKWPSYRSRL